MEMLNIIWMGREGKTLKVLNTGTVEHKEIKTEICDVMEGGEKAFNMKLVLKKFIYQFLINKNL